uniref:DUF8204 domain-containing protein n=1 Tax=Arundo donax TaxID=35708 RepID=A0A0A9HE04_ARUDO
MGEASPESGGAAAGPAPPRKGKSCKGCLYYSSVLKSRGYNPICVGIPRSIPQVPSYVVDEPKEEAVAQGQIYAENFCTTRPWGDLFPFSHSTYINQM